MARPGETETVFRLHRRFLYPLALLLAMPSVAAVIGLATRGLNARTGWSAGLTLLMILLFLPWLTRRVTVSPRGIASGTVFSRRRLTWGDVRRVAGLVFRGRAVLVVEGKASRLIITDVVGNFRHLVGYVVEHASGAVIEDGVRPLLVNPGRPREALVLWLAVAAMAAMMLFKYLH